jgi:hypothetical protein
MSVTIELTSSTNQSSHEIQIDPNNIAEMHVIEVREGGLIEMKAESEDKNKNRRMILWRASTLPEFPFFQSYVFLNYSCRFRTFGVM